MRSFILQSGANLLTAQFGQPQKLHIVGFSVGDRPSTQTEIETWDGGGELAFSAMQGNLVAQFGVDHMNYVNGGYQDKARLSCFIPESVPQILIANIVFYAGFQANGSDMQPFIFCGTDFQFTKLQTTSDSAGYSYEFNLLLDMVDLPNRFDFTNISTTLPEWLSVLDETQLLLPFFEGHDQLIITNHKDYGGVHPVFNAGNRFWGTPLMQNLTTLGSSTNFVFDGGVAGDGE